MIRYVYRRDCQLGAGGDGVVYAGQAIYLLDGYIEPVAIKLMYESQSAEHEAVQRFAREARAGLVLAQHPNLVATHAYGRAPDGRPYLVMDLAGPALAAVQGELCADHETIATIARAVLAALRSLADQGRAHGDVNAGNIFLGWDGRVKLGDYGRIRLAAAVLPDDDPAPRDDRRMLGILLHKLASGDITRPLPADTPPDLRAVIHGLLRPPGEGLSIVQAARLLLFSREPTATRDDIRAIVAQWAELYPDVFATSSGDLLDAPDADLIDLGPAVELAEHPGRDPAARYTPRPWRIAVAALLVIAAAVAVMIALADRPAVTAREARPVPSRIHPAALNIEDAPRLDTPVQPAEPRVHAAEEPGNDGPGRVRAPDRPVVREVETPVRHERDEPTSGEQDRRGRDPRKGRRDTSNQRRDLSATTPPSNDGAFPLTGRGHNRHGIRVFVDSGSGSGNNAANMHVDIQNNSGVAFDAAIIRLYDSDNQVIPARVKTFETSSQSPGRTVPVGRTACVTLDIPDASQLSGQILSLEVSEPGAARRVLVAGIAWP